MKGMMMNLEKDDPRLTAYALGELPAEEEAAVREAVARDAALQAEVASIRACAAGLSAAFAQEPLPQKEGGCAPEEGRAVRVLPHPARRNWRRIGGLAAAASVAIVAGLLLNGPLMNARTSALRAGSEGKNDLAQGGKSAETIDAYEETISESDLKEAKFAPRKMEIKALEQAALEMDKTRAPLGEMAAQKPGREREKGNPVVASAGMVGAQPNIRNETTVSQPAAPMSSPVMDPRSGGLMKQKMRLNAGDASTLVKSEEIAVDTVSPSRESHLQRAGEFHTEGYDKIVENEFLRVSEDPLSTFSIDVDTASYANVRRLLRNGQIPPAGAVRLEEFINYFDYDYTPPADGNPFATHLQTAVCPWNEKHQLLRVALKGKVLQENARPACNLVFLLDVSGSMNDANKLPLVKEGMKLLVDRLAAQDRVAIAVYAGASGLVLPSTPCSDKQTILSALDRLQAGGSTNGAAGIQLAYATAAANFLANGVNRVILCTDGDFNVGTTSQSDLVDLIEKKAKEKVFLTVLGFGMGNYKDTTLEKLSDKGNGNYGYIDTLNEAKKLLVEQMSGTLVTIAKDVKIQVEFNPARVQAYRLLGYENRKLNKEDFNDDKKDAGEIGAGHTVTALYELVPAGLTDDAVLRPQVDPLRYGKAAGGEKTTVDVPATQQGADTAELLTVKLRYKEPEGETSKLLTFPFAGQATRWEGTDGDFRFASAVAAFGMLLRGSQYAGSADWGKVIGWAEGACGTDRSGYRAEFLQLVRTAQSLRNR